MLPLILLGAGAAFLIYRDKQNAKPILNPQASPSQQPQPSQMYPFKPAPVVRVDTANQPWAPTVPGLMSRVTTRSVGGAPVQQSDWGSGLQIATQASQLWQNLDLGSYFSSGSDSDSEDVALDDVESYPDWEDWTNYDQSTMADEYA